MKMPKYDFFEKVITLVMLIVTLLGFYYVKTIYNMAKARIYDSSIILAVLLFIILEVVLLNTVLVYTIMKGRLNDENRK